jgi:putative MATE family efflux protein
MRGGPSQLTTGSIPKTLFTFTLPILMGNVLQSLNGSVNAIWVGKFLGPAALSATANANTVMFLLLGAVFGITMAATILIAQHMGARKPAEAKRVVGTSATFFLGIAVLISALGLPSARVILGWMGTPADSIDYAVAYMRVMLLALPPSYAFFFVMAALRGAGDSKTPFYFLVLSVALDIVLNPLLIFGVGPLPAMGIAGSATATLIAQVVSLLAMLRHIYRRGNSLALHRGELHLLRPDPAILRTLVIKGIPMGLQMIVLSSSMVMLFAVVNPFGSTTAAAFAAAMQLWNYVQMPALALSAAVSSMAAQNIGAGFWDRVREIARTGVGFNFLMTGIPILLLYLLNKHAVGLFLPSGSPSLEIAVHLNRIILWSFVMFGISMVLSGVMRAAGAVIAPLLFLFISLWVIRVPLSFWAADRYGPDGIWWSFALSAFLSMVMAAAYYLHGGWKRARMTASSAAGPATASGGEGG